MTVKELLLRHDFVAFSARLHLIIDGHLLPALVTFVTFLIFHCPFSRLFEVISSGSVLRVVYRSRLQQPAVSSTSRSSSHDQDDTNESSGVVVVEETIPLLGMLAAPAAGAHASKWNKVSITVSANQLQVFLNCQ